MISQEEIARGLAQIRWLKIYCAVITLVLAVFVLGAAKSAAHFDEIDVARINIRDASGNVRVVIANSERFPPVVLQGKTYQRAVKPAGLVFYDSKGSEVGGIAMSEAAGGRLSALALDYSNADAIGLMTRITPDGTTSGIVINSHPDEALPSPQAMKAANRRVALQNRDENAELVLSDSQGRARLRLVVGRDGQPSIEMLDEKGAEVYSLRPGSQPLR